jgi:hypothetical protein
MWADTEPSRFPIRDYSGKTRETTLSGFDRGVLAPVWSYGEALALAGSHSLTNGDPSSTQILMRHCGAQSQTVGQLESSGTTPTSKSM